jgi:hypothetical protein
MALTELPIGTGNDLYVQTIQSKMRPSPIQSIIFADQNKRFLDVDKMLYERNKINIDNKIAQIVGKRSEAKTIEVTTSKPLTPIQLDRSFETYTVDVGEWNNYDEFVKRYTEAYQTAFNNKIPFVMDNTLREMFDRFMRSEMMSLGLHFAFRQWNLRQAKHNSLLSTGRWDYKDSQNSPVFIDYGATINTITTPWSQVDTATPLTDLDNAIDAMQKEQQVPRIILMGTDACRYFERNTKEVQIRTSQVIGGLNIPGTVINSDITLTRAMMDVDAGYREVGAYRSMQIYCISKKVVVPTTDGKCKLVETFDPNAVSLVSLSSVLTANNFTDVYSALDFWAGENNTERVIIRDREWYAYHGRVSSDSKRKDYFCESKHAPVLEDPKALYIMNVA